ncbi:MAG: beta-mannosidase [Paludibacteraceae bacterium]|nr:beta-mannosidase [Paludibacteraceae bacterium]
MRYRAITLLLAASCLLSILFSGCAKQPSEESPFARFSDSTYFVGTNFWYGAILASQGQGGDRERLTRELDALQAVGINNLRVMIGADGLPGVQAKIEPTLQLEPGVYNDTILDGLDYLLAELGKRHMYSVLFFNNSWEWSGGYSQYLSWAKGEHWPTPQEVGYSAYMASCAEWSRCREAQELFYAHVRYIIGRTNRYTGLPYNQDPAIFSWQIGNEPRAFSMDVADEFAEWIHTTAKLIKELDPNHMVSTGSEGVWGCENDSALCARIHAFPEVDYITCHIWPYNWGWMKMNDPEGTIGNACEKTAEYLQLHERIAMALNKPLVVEEFGFPRDIQMWSDEAKEYELTANTQFTPTGYREFYYYFLFQLIAESHTRQGWLRGCNFWGWGGEAVPQHQTWLPGDPYTGDPAQEDQGLNSVFAVDEGTLALVHKANDVLSE